jgi:lysyl-tRNA synthetase class 2
MSIGLSEQETIRRNSLNELLKLGINPFPPETFEVNVRASDIKNNYPADNTLYQQASIAGRIMSRRIMGAASFVELQDESGRIQLYVKRDDICPGEDKTLYNTVFKKLLDIGDIIGVTGPLFKTRAGEVTVRADSAVLVSKSLRPLPEKWHGLTDPEQCYRQRYLDVIVNAESRERLIKRAKIVSGVRRFLENRQFIEVETPVLQGIAGGAAARPFTTHHNALGMDFVLRISLELYLKRMLVGGYDRVFEIGRNFRNEGISRRHNPEFTMLEVYQAYSDHRGMMVLIRDMILSLCKNILGRTKIKHVASGQEIDFEQPWREVKYKDLLIEATGDAQWFSRTKAEKIAWCEANKLPVNPAWEDFEVTNEIFGKRIEPNLIQPTFILNLPKELCPLAKISREDPTTIDVFELTIGGMEVAPAYSEQNDPDVQRAMFEAQAGEDQQKVDQDFLTSLEYGMPPAGGMGVGIDRLAILLTEAESIRDVILFPQLRNA